MPYEPNYQAIESVLARIRDQGGDVEKARALFRELSDLLRKAYSNKRILSPEEAYQAGKLIDQLKEYGLHYSEIAEALNVPPSSVKSWVQRYRRYVQAKKVVEAEGEVAAVMGTRTLKALSEILQRLVAHEMAFYIGLGKGAFDALRTYERLEIPEKVDDAVVQGYAQGRRLVEELLELRAREAEVETKAQVVEMVARDLEKLAEGIARAREKLVMLRNQLVEEAAAAIAMRGMVSPAKLAEVASRIGEALDELAVAVRVIAALRSRGG